MKVFVIMPFKSEFDDVYQVIRDSAKDASDESGVEIAVIRADEIVSSGRISLQINDEIRASDFVIADITGANGNVMYELGFSHALNKQAIILNQSTTDTPFDVRDYRQIIYDRNRLVRDFRPQITNQIVAAIDAVASSNPSAPKPKAPAHSKRHAPIAPSKSVAQELSRLETEFELLSKFDNVEIESLSSRIQDIVDNISIIGKPSADASNAVAAAIGNIAVEYQSHERPEDAARTYRKAIGLFPEYPGVRAQYADFLFEAGSEVEARAELEIAKSLGLDAGRYDRLSAKFLLGVSAISDALGNKPDQRSKDLLSKAFYSDPSNFAYAAAYLISIQEDKPEFLRACDAFEESLPPDRKFQAIRGRGDFFATNDMVEEAILSFRKLLKDHRRYMDNSEVSGTLHNLAVLVSRNGENPAEASDLWDEALTLHASDQTIRTAYAKHLIRQGRKDKAKAVLDGVFP